jgi:ABC-type branched-subunit amino acid transport system ATPase component
VAGAEPARRAGSVRTIARTPSARAEERDVEAAALGLLDVVGLQGRADEDGAALDGAQRRLLQVAVALAGGARVLLLDEPSAGMARAEEAGLVNVLRRLRDAGLTMVVVEHNLRVVGAVADSVTVLDAGRVLAVGRPDEVVADPEVQRAYLGD